MWLPRTHSLKTNGPVPTGFEASSSPYFSAAAGETMKPTRCPSMPISAGNGPLSLNSTVWVSSTLTESTTGRSCLRCGEPTCSSSRCSMFHFTTEASKSVPSWNFTFLRRWKTMRFPPSSTSQLSASSGLIEKSGPSLVRVL